MSIAGIQTLIEMLAYRADVSGELTAFTFKGTSCTFSELWQGTNRFASYLLACGLEFGERVVVALPNSREFFYAFYGIQRAGGIAVPVFPSTEPERIFNIASLCEARMVVVPLKALHEKGVGPERQTNGRKFHVLTVEESRGYGFTQDFPEVGPNDASYIQYTSGSTGSPKGVILSHDNLLTNIQQMIAGMKISDQEIFVSWLPVYHDMGLILKTMVPFYLAAQVHLLPADLKHVRTWLDAIQRYRATFIAAPDFAYRLCLRYIEDPERYNLSSLRVALNAAEPVRASTIEAFEKKFGLQDVMVAGYGLAESTVGVSMEEPGVPPRMDSHGLVSVGRPFPDVELMIVKGERQLPYCEIGEIAIRSLANCKGYFNNKRETDRLFWKDGYLLSGDLGYLDRDGYLFIVGRKKNMIKHAGETVAAQEIEEIVDADTRVRFSAALGIDRGGMEGEQVYIFAEVRGNLKDAQEAEEIVVRIVQDFHARLGFRPGRIFLLKPHAIPRTYNGKIQHKMLREHYLNGDLLAGGQILFPEF